MLVPFRVQQLKQGAIAAASGALLALGVTPMAALAQPGETSLSGTASAKIVSSLTVDVLSPLDFGEIEAEPDRAGTVRISPDGDRARFTAGASDGCDAGDACVRGPASFAVEGEPGRKFSVKMRSDGYAEAITTDDADAEIDTRLPIKNLRADDPVGQLDANGSETINVGGTLVVPAGAEAGRYIAEVRVLVTYS